MIPKPEGLGYSTGSFPLAKSPPIQRGDPFFCGFLGTNYHGPSRLNKVGNQTLVKVWESEACIKLPTKIISGGVGDNLHIQFGVHLSQKMP